MMGYKKLAAIAATSLAFCFNVTAAESITYINTCEQLNDIHESYKGTFQLTDNLYCEGVPVVPQGAFHGKLLGDGYSIYDLTIQANDDDVGLFESLWGAEINGLTFNNANIYLTDEVESVGIVSGRAFRNTKITDVNIDGSAITADQHVNHGIAMVVGKATQLIAKNVSVTASTINVNTSRSTGMLFGTLKDNSDTAEISTNLSSYGNKILIGADEQEFLGGIVGNAYSVTLDTLTSSGNLISGQSLTKGNVGLLVGKLSYESSITNAKLTSDDVDLPMMGYIAAGYIHNPPSGFTSLSNIEAIGIDDGLKWFSTKQGETVITSGLTRN